MSTLSLGENELSLYEIMLVQTSFARLVPRSDQVLNRFSRALFELDPALKELLPDDLSQHGLKLMHMLEAAVGSMHDVGTIRATLQELGCRHFRSGIRAAHYATMGAALQRALKEELEAEFTSEYSLAWAKAFWTFAQIIQEAADRERLSMYNCIYCTTASNHTIT